MADPSETTEAGAASTAPRPPRTHSASSMRSDASGGAKADHSMTMKLPRRKPKTPPGLPGDVHTWVLFQGCEEGFLSSGVLFVSGLRLHRVSFAVAAFNGQMNKRPTGPFGSSLTLTGFKNYENLVKFTATVGF